MPALRDDRGLTLIELCLVLLILGLIVTAASPRLSRSFNHLKSKTAAERVAQDLVMARHRAVLSGRIWQLIISSDGRAYSLEQQILQDRDEPTRQGRRQWQTVLTRDLSHDHQLRPAGITLSLLPDGSYPQQILTLGKNDSSPYEIHVESSGIVVRLSNKT